MQKIECPQIRETLYQEKLENGLEVFIIPKKKIQKKYVIFGPHFGSIDNHFIIPKTGEEVSIPDGVAHFLEHKMFEQQDGTDSLYTLMGLGIDANAYTTNDHTAYLFECTDHFYEGLDILMDYVQHPYFTDKNVEKEKGIIGQEIMMYNDDPGWQLYINMMDCLYQENPIKIDIAGSIESISHITPEVLYQCYNTFYNLSNMVLVVCGDFEPEKLLIEIQKRLLKTEKQEAIKRFYPNSHFKIHKKQTQKEMPISMPIFMIGYKDKITDQKNAVKRHIAIEILLNLLVGESSDLYCQLYQEGKLLAPLEFDYEFSEQYAHLLISGQAQKPEEVYQAIQQAIYTVIEKGISEEDFQRIRKKIYGGYVADYGNVANIGRMFFADAMKQINSFSYMTEFQKIDREFVMSILKEVFREDNSAISMIQPLKKSKKSDKR